MIRQQAIEVDHNGLTIRGMSYRPVREGRHPAVLLLHGFTGTRIENGFMFVRLARALASRGIAAVTFDFLHSGESDGSFEQMLVTGELADALRITEWLQSQAFVDRSRLGLLGFSLGGLLAGCVTARVECYRSLVMMAPTTATNIARHAQREGRCDTPGTGGGEAASGVQLGPHCLHPSFFDDVLTLDSVSDCVKRPRPTLVVQGTGDTAVPPAISAEFVDAMKRASVPVELHLIEGADHAFTHPRWRSDMNARVTDWFAKTLK
ncbi:MAG: alpha/beta fold hydrolase [Phycisphaeraceae bacterium]